MNRPSKLIVVQVATKANPKAVPVYAWHAAATIDRTLCGRHAGMSLVAAFEPVVTRYEVDDHGNETPVHERWPKHWPSTDNRPACPSCKNAAELLWRKVDREPNVRVLNVGTIAHALAGPVTEAVAAAKDRLSVIGYPGGSESGGGGVRDDTGHFAAEATELTDWLDRMRDMITEGESWALEMSRLVGRYAPKLDMPKVYCGDAQKAMSEGDRAGWTLDEQCRRLGTRKSGLCDRCGKRYDKREQAA